MRRIRKLLLQYILSATCILAGCETEKLVFDGPYFIRFTEATGFSRESYSKPIDIEVHLAGPTRSEDISVNFSVGGSAREGVDYVILGDQRNVIIPAGKFFGIVQIRMINNSNNILRSQEIIFTLNGANTSEVQAGQGVSQIGKTFTFTIFDDCILGGVYAGRRSIASIPVRDIQITSDDCEQYLLSNWNIQIFDTPFDMDLIFIDNGDNTLTIPSQEEDSLPEELATIEGTGIVDPLTREISMTITLVDFEDQPQVSFTLLPD